MKTNIQILIKCCKNYLKMLVYLKKLKVDNAEIPIFGTGSTYDYLNILSDNCNISVSNDTNSYSFSLGTVTYSSENSYFVDQSNILNKELFKWKNGVMKWYFFIFT